MPVRPDPASSETRPSPRVENNAKSLMTRSQMRVWAAARHGGPASGAFVQSCSLRITGTLDIAALQVALEGFVGRHDALRLRAAECGQFAEVAPELTLSLVKADIEPSRLAAAVAADAGCRSIW